MFYKPEALRNILSIQTNRKLSKNLEFSHNCVLYQIVGQWRGYRLRHATVTVCEHMNGEIEVIYNGSSLSYNILANNKKTPAIADAKEVSVLVDHLISQQNFSVA
ncbi:hypothetical protein FACS1894122_04840 [Alphaproteobacteria bacterium]|nr:hypothetical protein FACS1894122_04840 [Alphaproteobacteria bacterium]